MATNTYTCTETSTMLRLNNNNNALGINWNPETTNNTISALDAAINAGWLNLLVKFEIMELILLCVAMSPIKTDNKWFWK